MDAAKVHKLRKSYPDHVPVICESHPDGGEKQHKLIMPHGKTGAEFAQICRDKCPWAAADSKVWIKSASGLKEVPKTTTVKSLDVKMYKGQDDVLYVKVENQQQVKAESVATKSSDSDEDMSKSIQEFKMNGPAAKGSSRIHKVMGDVLDQGEKARRMREKYPDRVPVLVNQAESLGLPMIDRKLLVPRTMKVQDLRKCLPKHLKLQHADIPWDKVRMLMAGDSVEEDQCMGPIYDLIVDDDDGGLHLTLQLDCEPAALVALAPEAEDPEPAMQASREREENLQMALVQAQDELQEARHLREVALEQCLQEEDRAERAEQREVEALSRLEEKENRVEELQKELNEQHLKSMQYQNDLDQEIEARNMLEFQVRSLDEELVNKDKMLNSAQAALRQSGRESSAVQEKNLALEEKLVALEKEKEGCQRRLQKDEESILKLKDMCTQLKEKLAMREEAAKAEQERFRMQVKKVEQENKQLRAELEAMANDKAALAEEVRAFKDKAAEKEKEEDLVLVGWNLEGTPVDSEECNQSAEGFHLVPP